MAEGRLHPGPDRRQVLRDRGRAGARQEIQARHRSRGRPPGRARRDRDAAGGQPRDRAEAGRGPGLSRSGRSLPPRRRRTAAGWWSGARRCPPGSPLRRRASPKELESRLRAERSGGLVRAAAAGPASPTALEQARRARRSLARTMRRRGRIIFSEKFACPVSGFTIAEIEPRLFSFNAPQGACPACDGLGEKLLFRSGPGRPQPALSIKRGAVVPWAKSNPPSPYYMQVLGQPRPRVRLQPRDSVERAARGSAFDMILSRHARDGRSP